MSNWTKDHAGQYRATFNGDTFIARRNTDTDGWQLFIVAPDSNYGEDWCQSYGTFAAIKYDLSKI